METFQFALASDKNGPGKCLWEKVGGLYLWRGLSRRLQSYRDVVGLILNGGKVDHTYFVS